MSDIDLNNEPALMLLGPTASGKSAAAMRIAEQFPVEIISVDSAQVYRGMNIGTAKPSAAERAQVPHHLIDLVDPVDSYSAGQFARDAIDLIAQIRARHHKPLLVGGTMLYAKALTDGLNDLPGANPLIRQRLEDEARVEGWKALHQRLQQIDPVTAARLEPADAQRIQRALEVYELTGTAMSTLLEKKRAQPTGGTRFLRIVLEPSDRARLHQAIAQRFQAMMNAGFIDEVKQLKGREDLHSALPSMRCVGYRQLWTWLDNGAHPAQLDQAIAAAIAATRQLAKRQLTWLRSTPDKVTIDSLAPDAAEQALAIARRAWVS